MNQAGSLSVNPCIVEGVEPLLAELPHQIDFQIYQPDHAERIRPERFIHNVFSRRYAADIQAFYPWLLAFARKDMLNAVVGYRDGMTRPLFCEQYLEVPAEQAIAGLGEVPVARREVVEVGNLALGSAGQARWVIAAVTLYLQAVGYRWVLFTAVRPLVNAFQRLGLNPIRLAEADPSRLPDGGRHWGSYYDARPVVCAGDIHAGYTKLVTSACSRQPRLQALLDSVRHQAGVVHGPVSNRLGGGA